MAIEGLRDYQRRHAPGDYFRNLNPEQRRIARKFFEQSLARARERGKRITRQRRAAMIASAASHAKMTPEQRSAKARMMRATQGGYAVQRRYRARGIDPTLKANYVRLRRQGHSESAQRFLDRKRGEPPETPAIPVTGHQTIVPNPLRPGAPPMVVTVGRQPSVPGFWRRARIPDLDPQ